MKTTSLLAAGFAAALALTSPLNAAGLAGTQTVDEEFALHTFDWNGGGETMVRWDIYLNAEDYLMICGVFANQGGGASTQKFAKLALKATRIRMNGKSIMKNMSFFARTPNENMKNELVGTQANCKVTKTKNPDGDVSFEMTLDKTSFSY